MKLTDSRIKVHPANPDRTPIAQAARVLSGGGLVVFPTRCLYGLAANALAADAVGAVFKAKGRSPDNPVLILIRKRADLPGLVTRIPPAARHLMEKFWPGGLTLVFPAADAVPAILTAGTGKIGIRLPGHPVARDLAAAVGGPITGTSANVSGQPGCSDIDLLDESVATAAGVILDAGPLAGGAGSTVVDVTCDDPLIIRSGAISDAAIRAALADG